MFLRLVLTVLSICVLCGPAMCGLAMAQDRVVVRVGDHQGYSRVVFDWNRNVEYMVSKDSGGRLKLTFESDADTDLSTANIGHISNISNIQQISDGNRLQIILNIPSDSKYRHFLVGNRVVLDVYDTPSSRKSGKSVANIPSKITKHKPVQKKGSVKLEQVHGMLSKPPAIPDVEVINMVADIEPLEAVIDEPEKSNKKNSIFSRARQPSPHLITLSFTEAVGVAVFERANALWIVLDKPGINAPPQLSGPEKELFSPFKRYDLEGGTAFRMEYPEDTDFLVYGEGGGLLWRIILTANPRDVTITRPISLFQKNRPVRGGTVVWPLKMTTKILEVYDPSVGDRLKVVTVEQADKLTGPKREFVDFATLATSIGMTVRPKADYLEVALTAEGVEVSRPDGLAISTIRDLSIHSIRENVEGSTVLDISHGNDGEYNIIFDFERWMMGGMRSLEQNNHILQSGLLNKKKHGRVQDLITLAKMNLANDRGPEAIGFLRYANEEIPGLSEGAEFLALRGAAYALSGQYELAINDFMQPFLKPYGELDLWKAYTLAWLEDWQQAKLVMPEDYGLLATYPRPLLEKVGLKLAEVLLRSGDVAASENILALLLRERDNLKPWTKAGIEYLKGEAHHQSGEYKLAKERWLTLADIDDDFYRIRAGLSLVMLGLKSGEMTGINAINNLEGLRFLWRGDELEAKTNFLLGKEYLNANKYLKSFSILRDAVGMSPNSDAGKQIADFMSESFKTLLLEDEELSPIDAVAVYEEFRELTPSGDEGNKLVQTLAERLVEADLLGRATAILSHQVEFRLEGIEKGRVALRLAAIYLIDDKPAAALKALDVAKRKYAGNKKKQHEIGLLRARSLSELDRTEEALIMLSKFNPMPDVNLLRADVAWKAGLWEDAEEALKDIIFDEELDNSIPLTQYQADLILNRAVALHMAGDRVELANMSKVFGASMGKTSRSRLFEVIARPRQSSIIADEETLLLLIEEVDIFQNFLDDYRDF